MTEQEFLKLKPDAAWDYLNNAQMQRDDALARIATTDAAEAKLKEDNAKAVQAIQDKLDAAVKQAPVDQQAAVDAATAPLIAQIAALTQQTTDQKATLDKYAVLLAAKDAGPLADKLKKQAMVDTLTQQMADAQATHDKAAADLAALEI